MLNQLGLQNYEKNFKKGLLTDETLPLLNDRYMLCILNEFPAYPEEGIFKRSYAY
jgi:hypothetical protein